MTSLKTIRADEYAPVPVSRPENKQVEPLISPQGFSQSELSPPLPGKPKGKILREKEAEGTQAPNRFESDPINKSPYELDGQPLEVDTD